MDAEEVVRAPRPRGPWFTSCYLVFQVVHSASLLEAITRYYIRNNPKLCLLAIAWDTKAS